MRLYKNADEILDYNFHLNDAKEAFPVVWTMA